MRTIPGTSVFSNRRCYVPGCHAAAAAADDGNGVNHTCSAHQPSSNNMACRSPQLLRWKGCEPNCGDGCIDSLPTHQAPRTPGDGGFGEFTCLLLTLNRSAGGCHVATVVEGPRAAWALTTLAEATMPYEYSHQPPMASSAPIRESSRRPHQHSFLLLGGGLHFSLGGGVCLEELLGAHFLQILDDRLGLGGAGQRQIDS